MGEEVVWKYEPQAHGKWDGARLRWDVMDFIIRYPRQPMR